MPTIKTSQDNYEILLRIGGTLQIEGKKKISFNDVIAYLLMVHTNYEALVNLKAQERLDILKKMSGIEEVKTE